MHRIPWVVRLLQMPNWTRYSLLVVSVLMPQHLNISLALPHLIFRSVIDSILLGPVAEEQVVVAAVAAADLRIR